MLRLAITYDTAKNGGSAWHSLRSCQFKKLGEVLGTRRWLVPIQETRHKAWYFAVAHTTAQTSARLACSFLYPIQRLRKRKLNGYKKTECTLRMHSAKFVVGVARLVRREPCLRKGSRRNSDCYFVNRVSVSFGRTTS
mgnify:CR=1 FL=1